MGRLAAGLLLLAALACAGSPTFVEDVSVTGFREAEHAVMVRLGKALTFHYRGGEGVYAKTDPRRGQEPVLWPLKEPDHCIWGGVVCAMALGGRVISLDFNQLCIHKKAPDSSCVDINWDSLAALAGLQALEILSFRGATIVGGGFPPEWSSLSRLQKLTITSWTTNTSLALPEDWSSSFPMMRIMAVNNCNLSGTLPEAWHSGFPILEILELWDNNIGGSLPVSWAQGFPKLVVMSLRNNSLTGRLPLEWGSPSFPSLETLDLSDNPFRGSLPDGWAPPALSLHMANCGLEGAVPPALLRTADLYFFAPNNKLSGQLPPELCSSAMAVLDLQFNRLSGKLPSCNPALRSSFAAFNLRGNALTGSLPPLWPSVFPNMSSLDLSSNPINGTIPLDWQQPGAFPYLQYLTLSETFTDRIPFAIFGMPGVLQSLLTFGLAGCNISGRLGDLPNATYTSSGPLRKLIDLSGNRLSGSLPSSWAPFLASVQTLNISFNSLTGTVPASWLASAVRVFDFRGNALHGEITIPSPDRSRPRTQEHLGQTFLYTYPGNPLLCFPDTFWGESNVQVLPRQLECVDEADYSTDAATWPPCINIRVPSCAAPGSSRAAGIKGLLTFVFWVSAFALIGYVYTRIKGGAGSRLGPPWFPFIHALRSPNPNTAADLELRSLYGDASQAPLPWSCSGLPSSQAQPVDSGRYVHNLLGEVTNLCENLSQARRSS